MVCSISALKKSDVDGAILLRLYEIAGSQAETPVELLGKKRLFQEVNLLEENVDRTEQPVLKVNPYQIKTVELRIEKQIR